VHGLADHIVAAEREREIGDAAARAHSLAALLDQRKGLDERLRVTVVLLDPSRHRQDVGIEDDVLWGEPGLLGQQVISATADGYLALDGVGLPLLVEGHDHDSGPVIANAAGLIEEYLLALLEADRVHHAFALDALESGLEHAPARAVDHDR